jgi:hypothetical protein
VRGDWRRWREDVFTPAAAACGLGAIAPFKLRHVLCRPLLNAGVSPADVAARLQVSEEDVRSFAWDITHVPYGKPVSVDEQIVRARARVEALSDARPDRGSRGSAG